MQEKNHLKPPRNRGRPKKSALTPREQARLRKKRQRAKLAKNAVSKVEVFLASALKKAVQKAAGKRSLAEVGREAFALWLRGRSAERRRCHEK
jgi:hypothetical protein